MKLYEGQTCLGGISSLCRDGGAEIAHTPDLSGLTFALRLKHFIFIVFYILYFGSCGLNFTILYSICISYLVSCSFTIFYFCFEANRSEVHTCKTRLAWYPHSDPSTLCISYILYSVFFFISCNQNWYYCILYFDGWVECETCLVWHWHSDPSTPREAQADYGGAFAICIKSL